MDDSLFEVLDSEKELHLEAPPGDDVVQNFYGLSDDVYDFLYLDTSTDEELEHGHNLDNTMHDSVYDLLRHEHESH